VSGGFTTAGLGVIPGTAGDVDDVVRQLAWEEAHGGRIGLDDPRVLVYTARWADGSVAATACGPLGDLMGQLDQIEADGRCPVHGEPDPPAAVP
jgi:hypothetical protein